MNKNSKIIGFYSYIRKYKDDKEIRLYVYVSKNKETGKISYHVTDENSEEYKTAFAKYCKDNGYNKLNQDRIFIDNPDKINIKCDSKEEIFDLIKTANTDDKDKIKIDDFDKAFDIYDNKHKAKDKKKKGILAKVKNLKVTKKFKRMVVGFVIGITALSVGGFALKNCSNKSEYAIVDETNPFTDDNTNNNRLKDINDRIALAVDKAVDGINKVNDLADDISIAINGVRDNADRIKAENETVVSTSNNSRNDYSAPIERPAEEDILYFQDPDASLDDSSNSNSGSNTNNEEQVKEEDPYQNVIVEEEPFVETTPDEEYSEVIEVPAPSESEDENNNENDDEYTEVIVVEPDDDKENTEPDNTPDEPTNTPTEPSQDEDINKDDVILDDKFNGNEDAIDDDFTYIPEEEWGNVFEEELPDPNLTAEDGDYVSSAEEVISVPSSNDENVDFVPVEQESNTIETQESLPVTAEESTSIVPVEQEETTVNAKTTEQAVDEAVEAMANGEEGNLVILEDGTLSFEQTPNQTIETNGMTK